MRFVQKKHDKVCIMQYSRRQTKKRAGSRRHVQTLTAKKTLDEREGLPSRTSVQTTELCVRDMETSSPFILF